MKALPANVPAGGRLGQTIAGGPLVSRRVEITVERETISVFAAFSTPSGASAICPTCGQAVHASASPTQPHLPAAAGSHDLPLSIESASRRGDA